MPNRIVCITDCVDIAAAELRASLISALGESDVIIEPVVPIQPAFSAVNGNFAMRLMADCYPAGTVLMSTLGPLRDRPRAVIGVTETKELTFIGRDTGVFDWLTRDFGCPQLYDISHHYGEGAAFVNFAGRSITAPLAAKAAGGVPLAEVGKPADPPTARRLDLADFTVVHIDNFGNMKITGCPPRPTEGARHIVEIGPHRIAARYTQRMMSGADGTWALYPGSSYGLYELGMVRGCGAAELDVQVGDVLRVLPTD